MFSFDFVFILEVMKEIMEMEIINKLRQDLQQKSQDNLKVSSTKSLIQKQRDFG